MTQTISLHGLLVFVPDLSLGLAFYRDALGFEVATESATHVSMRGADLSLTLFRCDVSGSADGYASRAGSSVAFAVNRLEESMANLVEHGAKLLHASPASGPNGRYAAFADPFGTVHELVEVPERQGPFEG